MHKQINCSNCYTRRAQHYGTEDLCCRCYVRQGNPPADWHSGCMEEAALLKSHAKGAECTNVACEECYA